MIISDAYDNFYTLISTILNDHKELDDNVVIENNSDLKLKLGYAVEYGPSDNTERELNCNESAKQTVYFTNTIGVASTITDITKRKKAEKDLLENCYKIMFAVGDDPQLGGKCAFIKFVGHNGIEQIIQDNNKAYLAIRSTYTIEVIGG